MGPALHLNQEAGEEFGHLKRRQDYDSMGAYYVARDALPAGAKTPNLPAWTLDLLTYKQTAPEPKSPSASSTLRILSQRRDGECGLFLQVLRVLSLIRFSKIRLWVSDGLAAVLQTLVRRMMLYEGYSLLGSTSLDLLMTRCACISS